VVGEVTADGIDIVGVGTYPSVGLRRGVVVHIDQTVNSIKRAIRDAELMAGCQISSVFAGIAGTHVVSMNSHGVIAIKSREVTQNDVDRVLDAARAIAMPFDRQILHVLPQQYIVDDQEGIQDPLGMSGVRLEAKVHVVTGAIAAAQNILRCCERAGLHVNEVILESLAAGEAVLDPEEKRLGVALVDLGGGTTDLGIFVDNAIRFTSVLALGGSNITSDISVGLRASVDEAEKVKRKYGCASTSAVNPADLIEVASVGGEKRRQLARTILAEIIEARVEEILSLVDREIIRSGYAESIAAGVVLTGGVALLPGIREVAEQVFDMPVRIGIPQGLGGLADVVQNPMYSTASGLLLYANRHGPSSLVLPKPPNVLSRLLKSLFGWFKEMR
jgi:cell division protein FtsA